MGARLHGRVTREIRADGTTDTLYTYDLAGRLKTITDPMDQVTTYTYNIDDSLASTGFTNETIATPDISHTYDTYYPRPLTMVDGNGTTTYSYVAPGTNGAGQLASVDGPFSNDTITYSYDELGRVLTRLLNGTGTDITYDTLGRLSQLEFPIGTFDYTYVGQTGRVSTRRPIRTTRRRPTAIFDDEHDFRLQTIHHKNPSRGDAVEVRLHLRRRRQHPDVAAGAGGISGEDLHLHARSRRPIDVGGADRHQHDADHPEAAGVGVRCGWQSHGRSKRRRGVRHDATTALNRLQARARRVVRSCLSGSLNEAGTVTIDGKPATVDASNNFRGTAQIVRARRRSR